jgi:sulfur carrier protein
VKVLVKLSRSKNVQEVEISEGTTVEELLKKFNLKPDTVIVLDNDKPIPVDEALNKEQELTIIQVSSGG